MFYHLYSDCNMGSYFEINDTLQITTEQGFPKELKLTKHLRISFKACDFKKRIFEFRNKPNLRLFHAPPVRVFFAHNIKGKWLYWGQIEITELKLDYLKQTTSGKYRIVKIFSPEEMKQAESTIHGTSEETKYFNNLTSSP